MQAIAKTAAPARPATTVDPSKILVRAMKGYLYSPITKRLYYVHNRQEVGPSTYERPWSINPGYGFDQPVYPLNPVDYPTAETANSVLEWARAQWPTSGLIFDIYVPTPDGFVTQLQYWLVVWNGADLFEIYSAGWWAFDYDKDGQAAAYEQRTAELRSAGFSV
jgi:hypothetical protein